MAWITTILCGRGRDQIEEGRGEREGEERRRDPLPTPSASLSLSPLSPPPLSHLLSPSLPPTSLSPPYPPPSTPLPTLLFPFCPHLSLSLPLPLSCSLPSLPKLFPSPPISSTHVPSLAAYTPVHRKIPLTTGGCAAQHSRFLQLTMAVRTDITSETRQFTSKITVIPLTNLCQRERGRHEVRGGEEREGGRGLGRDGRGRERQRRGRGGSVGSGSVG